jgi:broad specificity phosphatase PhoE
MNLYFVRHGESEANIQHVISNYASPFGLTERGRQQVQVLAERLKDAPLTTMYSSPVLRGYSVPGFGFTVSGDRGFT